METIKEIKRCPKCGILPVKDKRRVMLGKIQDGGYTITQGRYRCPNCQLAPSWGKSYCIDVYGWTLVEVKAWNEEVQNAIDQGGKNDEKT